MMIPQDLFGEVTAPGPGSFPAPEDVPFSTMNLDSPVLRNEFSTEVGHKTLWVVCVVMGVSSIAFYLMATRVPVQKRLFHIITSFITTFAFLSYFAMATGSGVGIHTILVRDPNKRNVITEIVKRQVYWARYLDWSLTTPLLLLDLALLAGLNGASILILLVSDIIMILGGLFAAYSHDQGQGWGWYAIACIAFLNIIYNLGFKARKTIMSKDNKTKAFFGAISLYTLILWTVYPIIWAISDGARKMSVNGEIIGYAILDIFAKPVFGFWLLLTHDSMIRNSPSIGGFWANGLSSEGNIRVGDTREDD